MKIILSLITFILLATQLNVAQAYTLLDLKAKAIEAGISRAQYDIMIAQFKNYDKLKAAANQKASEHKDLVGSQVVGNKNYVMFIDFSLSSAEERLYVVNLVTGNISKFLVTHGMGSDINHNGYAESFSNEDNSHKSSLGLYISAGIYVGKHGESVRLHGLSSTNSNALERAIVMHAASYVSEDIADSQGHIGRSHGCPAMNAADWKLLKPKVNGGVLLLAYNEKLAKKAN
jgi:hypothetical protein